MKEKTERMSKIGLEGDGALCKAHDSNHDSCIRTFVMMTLEKLLKK